MSNLNYKICKDYNDYLELAKLIYKTVFEEDTESWETFFNANMKVNENTFYYLETVEDYNRKLGYRPDDNEYPLLVTYYFNDDGYDKWGNCKTEIWDWISLKELGI